MIVGPGRHSADNGDDSADDLDESHTDDNSRITDFENETPSFSEDTFSKEDVFFGTNAIGSVPVIPTSSQYGLAIVAPNDRTNGGEVLTDAMHVNVTDSGINIMGHGKSEVNEGKEVHHRNERFKVVKIESTEPFKRGRWVCMDYLDHTTLQQPKEISGGGESNEVSSAHNATVTTQDSGVGMNDNASYAPSEGMDYYQHAVSSSSMVLGGPMSAATSIASNRSNVMLGMLNNESPGQSLNLSLVGGISGGVVAPGTAGNATSHIQSGTTGLIKGPIAGTGIPHSLPQSQLQNALAGHPPMQQHITYTQGHPGQSQYYPHTMTNLAELNQQVASNIQAQHHHLLHHHHQHGATLPSNMQMHPQLHHPHQQQPGHPILSSSNILPPLVVPIPTSQEMNIMMNNPTIQSSFPSPHQQFKPQKPQQTVSQTNSPIVVPTSLIDNTVVAGMHGENVPLNGVSAGAKILSPSAGAGGVVSNVSTTGGVSAHDTAGSVSIGTDSLKNSAPSATSSPVTSSVQLIPQSTTVPTQPAPGASIGSYGDASAMAAAAAAQMKQNTNVPSSAINSVIGGNTIANGANCVAAVGSPSSSGAINAANSISVGTIPGTSTADQQSSEVKLQSTVSGATTAAATGDVEETDKPNAEDGER